MIIFNDASFWECNKGALCFSRHILLQTFDSACYICYNSGVDMNEEAKTPRNIRIRPSVLHQARVAAVIQKKTLGQWLEDAIIEKIEREQKHSKEDQK